MTICSRAQLRLSLAGGGTDLPEYYEAHGAELLAVGLSIDVLVRTRPRQDSLFTVNGGPARSVGADTSLVAALLRRVRPVGADFEIECPVSAGAGLGGSGALSTAIVAGLRALEGWELDELTTVRLAFEVEREGFGSRVGIQDHVTAAYGGLVRLAIERSGRFHVNHEPQLLRSFQGIFEAGCMLLDTGLRRSAKSLLEVLAQDLTRRDRGGPARQQRSAGGSVEQAIRAGDLASFGAALHEQWLKKRSLCDGMSSPQIDEAYQLARELGAFGGKLIGAGGGGFMLLACPPAKKASVQRELEARGLTQLRCMPSSGGLRLSAGATR